MADIKQTVVTKVVIDNKEGIESLKKQETAQDNVTKSTEEGEEATQEMTGALDGMASSLGLNVGAMKSSITSIGKMVKGFKTLRVAIIATGIGALIIALTSLFAWFNRSAEGQEKLAIITATLGEVFNQMAEVAADLGEAIFNAFNDPKKAVSDLWEAIKKNLINRVKALPLLFSAIGKAITSAFKGNFSDSRDALKDMGVALIQMNTGLDEIQQKNVMGKLAEKSKEIADNVRRATQIQKEANNLRRQNIEFITREAELERDISEARRIANDDQATFLEQQKAIVEAERLTKVLSAERRALLAQELDQLERKNALGRNTLEDIEAEENLKRQIINLDKQSNDLLRSLSRRHSTINNQLEAENTAKEKGLEIDTEVDKKQEERSLKAEEKLILAEEAEEIRRAKQIEDVTEQANKLLEIEASKNLREQELAKDNKEELALIEFQHQVRVLKIQEDAAKKTAAIEGAKTTNTKVELNEGEQAALDTLNIIGEKNKELGLVAALANAGVGITKTIATLGFPAAIPALIAQAVTVGNAVAAIRKASKGMMIEGHSHTEGGVNIMTPRGMIEAEGGEFIMNKASTAMFKDELSAISQAGGGIPLAQNGMLIEGASRQSSAANLSSDISNAVNKTQTVLVTEDLEIVQSRVSVTEDIATL